jgi:hypothetical protein
MLLQGQQHGRLTLACTSLRAPQAAAATAAQAIYHGIFFLQTQQPLQYQQPLQSVSATETGIGIGSSSSGVGSVPRPVLPHAAGAAAARPPYPGMHFP